VGTIDEIVKETIKPLVQFVFGKTLAEFMLLAMTTSMGLGIWWFATVGQPAMVETIHAEGRNARTEFRDELRLVREEYRAESREWREAVLGLQHRFGLIGNGNGEKPKATN
jgi:hypothetical protein